MREHKYRLVVILIGIVFFLILAISEKGVKEAFRPITKINSGNQNQEEMKFSGTVISIDTSCFHDGVCKIKVGDSWIITDLGGDPTIEMVEKRGPRGKIILASGTQKGSLLDEMIGRQVEVFVKRNDLNGNFSLYGSNEYYIKFLN